MKYEIYLFRIYIYVWNIYVIYVFRFFFLRYIRFEHDSEGCEFVYMYQPLEHASLD